MKKEPVFSSQESLLAFIHIEKTAGETMKWILRSSFGISHCDISSANVFKPLRGEELSKIGKIYPKLQSIAGHPVTPYMQLEKASARPIQYFSFLRDPVKQYASYFQYQAVTLKIFSIDDFDKWLLREWPQNMQTKRLCGEANAEKAIEVIKKKNIFMGLTERFDESIFLLKELVNPHLYLGYRSRNKARSYSLSTKLLTDKRTRALIEDAVSEDIKLYRWVKDELYPKYIDLYIKQADTPLPDIFPYKEEGFRSHYGLMNRVYRNLIYRPLEIISVRKQLPIYTGPSLKSFRRPKI